jgi:hypothetical protein
MQINLAFGYKPGRKKFSRTEIRVPAVNKNNFVWFDIP